jgi:HAD superfamily hydrolase (TIGR01549 family)
MGYCKWIFFDIGSTLVDESECYEVRYKETTDGTDVSYQEFKDKIIELAATNDNPYKEAVKFFGLQKTKWYKELEKPYPFTESVLAKLSEKYKLGIIANQSAGSEKRLVDWGIGKYFDLVIASAEEGVEKPNPEIFKIALDRAKCESHNAVMVGDRLDNDIIPAKKIGMKTVWVKQAFAKYQPDSDIPDYIINTLDEINNIL